MTFRESPTATEDNPLYGYTRNYWSDLYSHGLLYGPHEQDVDAYLYYASYGGADPKNFVVDGPGLARLLNIPIYAGIGLAVVGGALTWGTIGWVLDPHDRRSGGLWERQFLWTDDTVGDRVESFWESGEDLDDDADRVVWFERPNWW